MAILGLGGDNDKDAYHGKVHDIPQGSTGVFKNSNTHWPPAQITWTQIGQEQGHAQTLDYWVGFRNIELDVEQFDVADLPELGRSLDLAELALGKLGKDITAMVEYHDMDLDQQLADLARKQGAPADTAPEAAE